LSFRWGCFARKLAPCGQVAPMRGRDFGIAMRASNLVIGTTMLAVIAAGFVSVLAVQKIRGVRNQSPLRIVFNGSASGLRKGGTVSFDGVPAGEIMSIKLENPRKIVALVTLDNSAPIRKDTTVGIEFQGLTGVANIALVGGAPAAPPVPLDEDGIPVLSADWSEQQSITDTLHNVDRLIVDNQATIKDALLSFETYTASLKSKGEAIDSILGKADDAFASFDSTMTKINGVLPGLGDGKAEELFEKVKSLHEMADTFKEKSATLMEEGRRTLLDVSEAANRITAKFGGAANPATPASPPAPPRRPQAKRQ
jgi:phospholipid/cholesterol/gamma-HCH transport system substrate-binding protein